MTPANTNTEKAMNDVYLSKNRDYINQCQRQRRAKLKRIDYMPNKEAAAIIDGKRGRYYPMNIVSRVIDAILIEWADQSGIKYQELEKPKSSVITPELCHPIRARANDFGDLMMKRFEKLKADQCVVCGAKTQSGKPCRAKVLPFKKRCKWHGGCSTGPKTSDGKIKALRNLKQNRKSLPNPR